MDEKEAKIFKAVILGLSMLFTALFLSIGVSKWMDAKVVSQMIAAKYSASEMACILK